MDRHRFDADQDPDPTFHFDANLDLDPDPDLNPFQVFHTVEKSRIKFYFYSQQCRNPIWIRQNNADPTGSGTLHSYGTDPRR